MLRMKALLLLAVATVAFSMVFSGCSGVSETEPGNGVGTTPPVDTTLPSSPTGLTGAAAGSTGADLSWSASTDNVGVTGYIVRRNGVQIATPATTSYADTGLS
ncbi:MAG TPA: fibronectin type III domain-containing protein, partial [Burkholderiales bacterium]|nr:fibronectin type III domain-containing protein [Burkholderiales bacterium]